jgi:hypothetical protein
MDKRKLAIGFASLVGIAVVGYLGWWVYKKYRTSSADPTKNNRDIRLVRS